jgi:hypothetical protein
MKIGSSTMWQSESLTTSSSLIEYSYRFADRDLLMRFRGGGVGHMSTREATDSFKKDRDRLDERSAADVEDDQDELMAEEREPEPEDEDEVDEDEENDYGYAQSDSEDESVEGMLEPGEGDVDSADEYFGPEDDGGVVDLDLDVLGYADL